ncbi:hypothetical protein FRB93_006855 [Tulasnella sp. JGI-2019a]|nr:hypothetical protein FRB93_006855 [Tulasnella sp. JGI-2019a]
MLSDPELEFGQRLIEQLPTPRLRTLQIMHWAREPLEVHGEKLVGLHDLTLRGVFVDLGSSIPSGLRQLELRELQNGGRPSLTQILTVLRASPELNRLELGYDILDESQVNGIAAGSLELPYLLSLKLDLQWEMIQTILAYLRFPNCIDMVVNARPSSSPDTSTILPTHVISQARSIIAAEGEPTVMLTRMTAALAASPVSEALHILLPLPLKDQIRWIDTILESTQVPPHPIALEARFDPVLQPDVPIPPLPSHTHHIISLQLTGCGEGVASWLKLLSEPTEGEQPYWHLPNLEDLTLQIWWNDHAEALLTMARYRYGRDTQSDGGSIPSGPVKSDDQGGIADERYNDCKTLPLPTNSSKLPAPLKKLTVYAHPTISNEAAQELKSIIGRDKVSWERLSGITEL